MAAIGAAAAKREETAATQSPLQMPLISLQPKSQTDAMPLLADAAARTAAAASHEEAMQLHSTPLFATICGLCLCPCTLLQSWIVVDEGQQKIVMNTGRLVAELREPGIYFYNCCQREVRSVSTRKRSLEIRGCKVADKEGNPIVVSAVLVVQVIQPRRVLLGVQDWGTYALQQGMAVLRQVVARYPYEARDGGPSLRSDTAHVNEQLAAALAQALSAVGLRVLSFRLDEIAFSPEVASLMLKRQAAKAVVEARRVIVEGAVGLTHGAVEGLRQRGLELSREQSSRLVSNLLTVLCSAEAEA